MHINTIAIWGEGGICNTTLFSYSHTDWSEELHLLCCNQLQLCMCSQHSMSQKTLPFHSLCNKVFFVQILVKAVAQAQASCNYQGLDLCSMQLWPSGLIYFTLNLIITLTVLVVHCLYNKKCLIKHNLVRCTALSCYVFLYWLILVNIEHVNLSVRGEVLIKKLFEMV